MPWLIAVLLLVNGSLLCALEQEQFTLRDGREIVGEVLGEEDGVIRVRVIDGRISMEMAINAGEIADRETVTIADEAEPAAEGAFHPVIRESIGDRLVDANGKRVKDPRLGDRRFLMFYFCASWCGHCRKFTPELVEWYNGLGEDRDVEVIFVSEDRERVAAQDYVRKAEMPWYSLLFGSSKTNKIKRAYSGRGIPCLVLLGPDDEVIQHSYEGEEYVGPRRVLQAYEEARAAVAIADRRAAAAADEGPHAFLRHAVRGHLRAPDGSEIDSETLAERPMVAVYFSAHWCAPCRKFTPHLVEFYQTRGGGSNFEIIFASSDRSDDEMQKYIAGARMPWLHTAYDSLGRSILREEFAGPGIPCLVLFGPDGQVIADSYQGEEYLGPGHVLNELSKRLPTRLSR